MFFETYKQIITIVSTILGNDNDKTIDQYALGLMNYIFPPMLKPLVKYNYPQFLADNIHYELLEFEATKYFRYQSYLIYLFLYSKLLNSNILK